MNDKRFTNALIHEKSPYLLQHAHNPVDWLPWGPEAFRRSREEDKPIFLSVGYSTCHWCHVMERESFENEEIAQFLNEHFISVKVDREERPDVDSIYMTYVQMRNNGHGGWPMSVWLTPELTPFFGGTYFPPDERYGRAGFKTILRQLSEIWRTRRDSLMQEGRQVTEAIQQYMEKTGGGGKTAESGELPANEGLARFVEQCHGAFDERHGGFNGAPKFPRPAVYRLLLELASTSHITGDHGRDADLRRKAEQILRRSLQAMAAGGMYDQVGGGFHRYAVDERWHVPHFEKMLYDQGQLVICYLEGAKVLDRRGFRAIATETLDYILRDLTAEAGGFYSAEDADSLPQADAAEKIEGAFYTWTWQQLEEVLEAGEQDRKDDLLHTTARIFGAEKAGNVEPESDAHGELSDQNVLFRQLDDEQAAMLLQVEPGELAQRTARIRQKLFEAREKRPRPHLDDKVVTAWNGLTIAALSRAGVFLDEPPYVAAAGKAVDFLKKNLYDNANNKLLRTWRDEPSEVSAFAGDYAFLIDGLLEFYQATLDVSALQWALDLQEQFDALYWHEPSAGYLSVTTAREDNILSIKEIHDGAEPSPNSVAARNLLRLSRMFHKPEFQEKAETILRSASETLTENPYAAPELALALHLARQPPRQAVLCWEGDFSADSQAREMHALLHSASGLSTSLIGLDSGENRRFLEDHNPAMKTMTPLEHRPTVYLCEDFTCRQPVNDLEALQKLLGQKT